MLLRDPKLISDVFRGSPDDLFDLLLDCRAPDFGRLVGNVAEFRERALVLAQQALARRASPDWNEGQRQALAERQAHAEMALILLGAPDAATAWEKLDTAARERLGALAAFDLRSFCKALSDKPDQLIGILLDRPQGLIDSAILSSALREKIIDLGQQTILQGAPANSSAVERSYLANRQANAVATLFRLGWRQFPSVATIVKLEPAARLACITTFMQVDPSLTLLVELFNFEPEEANRRAILFAIATNFTEHARLPEAFIKKVLDAYENAAEAGTHIAADAVLRQWGKDPKRTQAVSDKLRTDEKGLPAHLTSGPKRWYINQQGQTFAIIDTRSDSPVYVMTRFNGGTQRREAWKYKIGRRFAIATEPVHKDQYRKFLVEVAPKAQQPSKADSGVVATGITWYEAARYCNWLSKQEGIEEKQWCYEPNDQGSYSAGMKAREKFWKLSGYRLPTFAECNVACTYVHTLSAGTDGSSGAVEPRFGSCEWLKVDEWHTTAKLHATSWCFDEIGRPRSTTTELLEDLPSTQPIRDTDKRVSNASDAAWGWAPNWSDSTITLRPARTLP